MTHINSKKEFVHAHVVLLMKEMGYGLMTDGTFYKLGHETAPHELTTFTMTQAYEVHDLFRSKLADGYDSDNTKERINNIVDYVDGCTKLPEDKLFYVQRATVENRIGEMFVTAVKAELTQALKELKDEAREWSVLDAELLDYQTGTELTYIPIEAIDNKINALEEV